MKIAQVFLGGKQLPFHYEYKSKEDALRAIAFTQTRGETWMLEGEVGNTEQVQGIPCGTGWAELDRTVPRPVQ
jgi:hypothetical protein